jgi:hypothetical protein
VFPLIGFALRLYNVSRFHSHVFLHSVVSFIAYGFTLSRHVGRRRESLKKM